MISVHFQGKPFNITVIQVYAPTSNAKEAEVECFYEDLQDLLDLTPKKDALFIIRSDQISRSVMSNSLRPHELQHTRPPCPSPTPRVHPDSHPLSQWCHPAISSSVVPFSSCPQSLPASGDWNAKVGSQEIPGITGKFGLEVQNEAGQRQTEFCQENPLVLANTLFQQHKRRLYTWTSPDGQYQNQIDYILCSQRWRSSIQSAKARPGANCGSDHELLIAKFRLK